MNRDSKDGRFPNLVGRAAGASPSNRFEKISVELDELPEYDSSHHEDALSETNRRKVVTEFYEDRTSTLIQSNESPDLRFRYSLNPYRGCEHGCAYCYARPGHEYLGMSAGIDFESKILVKRHAAKILRRELNQKSWQGEFIAISGVTDCYQPAERRFQLTRQCLKVLVEAKQPFGIVTKNALVTRDVDLLAIAAEFRLVHVYLSVTSLDSSLLRRLEPRTSVANARLGAIRKLSNAGVPVGVSVSPVIPGLNDNEIPMILEAAAKAGARAAFSTLLRLPYSVQPIFRDWLAENYPDHRDRVESRIRACRGGKMNSSEFGERMSGSGPYAENIRATFRAFAQKFNLQGPLPALDHSRFQPPQDPQGQQWLF